MARVFLVMVFVLCWLNGVSGMDLTQPDDQYPQSNKPTVVDQLRTEIEDEKKKSEALSIKVRVILLIKVN